MHPFSPFFGPGFCRLSFPGALGIDTFSVFSSTFDVELGLASGLSEANDLFVTSGRA